MVPEAERGVALVETADMAFSREKNFPEPS